MSDEINDIPKVQERQQSVYDRGTDDADAIDPDLALISDYLADVLSFDEQALVERRMKDDEAFFEKVWPLVRAWQQTGETPVPPRRDSRHWGTVTDEIRSIALRSSPSMPRPVEPWFIRLSRYFRRTPPT
jgi:hypothetical protein